MLKIFQLPELSKIYCALKILWKAASFHIVVNLQMPIRPPRHQACPSPASGPQQSGQQRLWQVQEKDRAQPRASRYFLRVEEKGSRLKGFSLKCQGPNSKNSSIKHLNIFWFPHHFKTQMVQRLHTEEIFFEIIFHISTIANLAERITKCKF